jgi:hypothetical protein
MQAPSFYEFERSVGAVFLIDPRPLLMVVARNARLEILGWRGCRA